MVSPSLHLGDFARATVQNSKYKASESTEGLNFSIAVIFRKASNARMFSSVRRSNILTFFLRATHKPFNDRYRFNSSFDNVYLLRRRRQSIALLRENKSLTDRRTDECGTKITETTRKPSINTDSYGGVSVALQCLACPVYIYAGCAGASVLKRLKLH